MADKTTFSVEERQVLGSKVKNIRNNNQMPGNVYGIGKDSEAVILSLNEFARLYDEVGETGVVYLKIGDRKQATPVLIDEVQVHPVTNQPLHVAFKRVDLSQEIEAEIPVELIGEFDVSQAVMVQVKKEIEVEALPEDLPDNFQIDLSTLTEIGQMITLKDLDFDKSKVKLVGVETDEDWEQPVVLVQEQREEEVEEEVSPDDVELVGETDQAEGEEAGEATGTAEAESTESE